MGGGGSSCRDKERVFSRTCRQLQLEETGDQVGAGRGGKDWRPAPRPPGTHRVHGPRVPVKVGPKQNSEGGRATNAADRQGRVVQAPWEGVWRCQRGTAGPGAPQSRDPHVGLSIRPACPLST